MTTSTLIDTASLAEFRAQQQTPKPRKMALSDSRARRLSSDEWRGAYGDTLKKVLREQLDEAVTRPTDLGRAVAADLVQRSLDLAAFGIDAFAGSTFDARRALRDRSDVVLQGILNQMLATVKSVTEEAEVALREQAEEKANALLAEAKAAFEQERDMATAGADEVQRELSEYRRAAEAASAQLVREREASAREVADLKAAHAANVTGLQQQLTRAARIAADQERSWNEQRRQLLADQAAAQTTIAHLNSECERLEASHVPQPKVVTRMPNPDLPQNALEEASLTNYLRDTLNDPKIKLGAVVISDEQLSGWRATYPTKESQLKQVRAVVFKGRAA
ncbi:hypothetical protein [Deinococcus sp. QL22]|uniref:hypothetical protein n=1 Tax=Deinococcus sp. QL22 TaxID=2939437 RepID=UPI002017E440|nr:hypothetical protein [Deinococcus sp. QL22]UQN10308.1 hypothetical protein M1R55_29595 [Deinococcus sp. QL22]UQN10442.1 hypothetical protein M1R55_28920 [Deinococcus sp. QL22]